MCREFFNVCLCFLALNSYVFAQEGTLSFSIPGPNELSLIKMKGEAGVTYVGSIVDRNQSEVTLLTDTGTKITVLLSNVQDIRAIPKSQIHDGDYWYPNPNDSRYLFAPSAFNLKKGEGYYPVSYTHLTLPTKA